MTLQDVADEIHKAQEHLAKVQDSDEARYAYDHLVTAYQTLVAASSEIVAQLDEVQEMARDARANTDAA